MKSKINRRQALGLMSAVGLSACAQLEATRGEAISKRFIHGVASGDSTSNGVVLWTRVETEHNAQPVSWQLARDEQFSDVLQSGTYAAKQDADHTVKIIVEDLPAGSIFYYRFAVGADASPIGRTRTLPTGHVKTLGIALASCSNYAFGFFNAYDAIARDPAIEFVLHTGDYIYEFGHDGWGAETARQIGREHLPAHETLSLDDYRQRHAQYKRDKGSIAMHAAHPLLACWDDHEVTNNPWQGGAQNHQADSEGSWQLRRQAAIQAYYEWMPIRDPVADEARLEFWRGYEFGDLATLVTLETRHTGRAEQIDYADYAQSVETPEDARKLKEEIIGESGRAMMSANMESFLADRLRDSVSAGKPWRLIGNPCPIARMDLPDMVKLGAIEQPEMDFENPTSAMEIAWKGFWNLPFYTDSWDGYPWARQKLYDLAADAGAKDLLFLTGDSHSFWANQLADDRGEKRGLEIGTAAISSPGDFISRGFDVDTAKRLDKAMYQNMSEVVWTDGMHQGYVRLVVSHDKVSTNFIAVSTVLEERYKSALVKRVDVVKDGESIVFSAA